MVGIAELERRIGLERSTISRHCRAGTFPRPMYLGTRRFWTEEQIATWEVEQFARQPELERHVREMMEPAQAARRSAVETWPPEQGASGT